jgi:hypothetical protein
MPGEFNPLSRHARASANSKNLHLIFVFQFGTRRLPAYTCHEGKRKEKVRSGDVSVHDV